MFPGSWVWNDVRMSEVNRDSGVEGTSARQPLRHRSWRSAKRSVANITHERHGSNWSNFGVTLLPVEVAAENIASHWSLPPWNVPVLG